jgi:predicted O-methyltransferase YrrM
MPPAAPTGPARPFRLADFHHIDRGATVIVCGCGESLNRFGHPECFTTIGVNDVGRKFDPTYLVVLNPRHQFAGDRFRYVEQSRARYLFTQLDLKVPHPAIVQFRLGRYGGTSFDDPHVLHFTRNSPYVALCLAVHLGASTIGLIGVDFTDHHFFAHTGTHPLSKRLDAIDAEYRQLRHALDALGVRVVNLSPDSRLTAFDKGTIDGVASDQPVTRSAAATALHVVSYATTPVAGVPAILARCISDRTGHHGRCVWAASSYGNGVSFDGDIEWQTHPAQADSALRSADVVVVHNGKIDGRHEPAIARKAVVTLAHNYMWNVDRRFERQGLPALVVGQYQATLPEFAGWQVVPNPVPTWEPAYRPERKPDVVTICYTPSGRHERYPIGHRLYWHGKGYHSTMQVLRRLAASMPVRLEVVADRQVSHADALAMKRRAHIVIDECVTGSFHRNSLEGLAAGCVVINGVGLLPGVAEALQRCALDADRDPFVFSTLESLEVVLRGLIERGPDALAAEGQRNRAWIEQHWDFRDQWTRFWEPAIEAAREHVAPTMHVVRGAPHNPQEVTIPVAAPVSRSAPGDRVSVVVPHGGRDRLPQLAAALASLRQQESVNEVIVAEMGTEPTAQELARSACAKYVFIVADGPFERARALNVGSSLAEEPLVLWFDNDLVVNAGFVARATRELRERRVDYLLPYTSVHYLSEADSAGVMSGRTPPAVCRAVRILYSGRTPGCSGGAGLVTRDFLRRYGGFIEGFRGWGGEDNAWNVKVRLLGRWAATKLTDQHAFHLFHPSSAGYPGESGAETNPDYSANVALLERVQRTRHVDEFLRQFPAAAPEPCAWDPVAKYFVAGPRSGRQEGATPTATAESHIRSGRMSEFRNVFACLVHDNQECVLDLVRNLRYLDPASTVLLYNGGRDPSLLTRDLAFRDCGAIVHPNPRPQSWGHLHEFALDCMRYALDHLAFDAVTIVDSDQLAAQSGYSEYIAPYFRANPLLGICGSSGTVQPRTTRVAPVVAAYREYALWQPFLSRFHDGPSHFGRWTFWPATAFSAAAARDLTHLFATDEQLQDIMRRSQIWASEEVIFPMLAGALGYQVVESPCSYQYVRFRVAYSRRDIDRALTRPNVFWIHPVNRRYDDPLRARIRSRFNDYQRPCQTGASMPAVASEHDAPPFFLMSPVLKHMRQIEGWLEDDEAEVLIAATRRAIETLPAPHAIVEVGSYCGRSTVVLGAAARAHHPDARVYAVDPHDGVVGALDQELKHGPSTLERFQHNVAAAKLQDVVVTIQQCSIGVVWNQPVSLLFIDHLHDYASVSHDFHHFAPHLVPGGFVAFHDYADYYPGVKAFVNELLASSAYEQVVCAGSMVLLRKRVMAAAVGDVRPPAVVAANASAGVERQRASA